MLLVTIPMLPVIATNDHVTMLATDIDRQQSSILSGGLFIIFLPFNVLYFYIFMQKIYYPPISTLSWQQEMKSILIHQNFRIMVSSLAYCDTIELMSSTIVTLKKSYVTLC